MLTVGCSRSPESQTIHRCTNRRTPYRNSPLTCDCPYNKIAPAQWRRVVWDPTKHLPNNLPRQSLRHDAEARPPPSTALPRYATHAAHPEPWPARATTPGNLQAPSVPRAASLCALAYTSPVPMQAGGCGHGIPGRDSSFRYDVVISGVEHGTERGRRQVASNRHGSAQNVRSHPQHPALVGEA